MSLVMVGVTVWSCFDGKRGAGMMAVASIAAIAAMNALALAAAALPQTRLYIALFSALWVIIYMPAWDWLGGRFIYPQSLWSAVGFGAAFGLIRFAMARRGPSRPPW